MLSREKLLKRGCIPILKNWVLALKEFVDNVGHMYEAAVAYNQATGKHRFLEVAIKNADLIDAVFWEDKLRDVPGHQEIEMGLVRLYRVVGDDKYLKLAKFFLDERGHANGRSLYGLYCQDHLPVTQKTEAVGHSVRAAYMCAGMADVAALMDAEDYISAIKTIWGNVVTKKLALTGEIGARHEGDAFGDNYELPNLTSNNETCAVQANIYWNHRLFLLTVESKYIDILERTLYNGFLAGIDLGGEAFFYINPLASDGQFHFNRDNEITRQPWFDCSSCPMNVVRLLPSLSGYIYAMRERELFVNLYIAGQGTFTVEGNEITLKETTNYPWDDSTVLQVSVDLPTAFRLKLRIPSWVQNQSLPGDLYHYMDRQDEQITVIVDGDPIPIHIEHGYVSITREWHGTTRIEITLPMHIRRVVANSLVEGLQGKVALERGPLAYAVETADNPDGVLDLVLPDSSQLVAEYQSDLLQGVIVITGEAHDTDGNSRQMRAIPYYSWGHRQVGELTVWLNLTSN